MRLWNPEPRGLHADPTRSRGGRAARRRARARRLRRGRRRLDGRGARPVPGAGRELVGRARGRGGGRDDGRDAAELPGRRARLREVPARRGARREGSGLLQRRRGPRQRAPAGALARRPEGAGGVGEVPAADGRRAAAADRGAAGPAPRRAARAREVPAGQGPRREGSRLLERWRAGRRWRLLRHRHRPARREGADGDRRLPRRARPDGPGRPGRRSGCRRAPPA